MAESGIADADHVRKMGRLGAAAVLVGETLMKAGDLATSVRLLSTVQREFEV